MLPAPASELAAISPRRLLLNRGDACGVRGGGAERAVPSPNMAAGGGGSRGRGVPHPRSGGARCEAAAASEGRGRDTGGRRGEGRQRPAGPALGSERAPASGSLRWAGVGGRPPRRSPAVRGAAGGR